MPLRDKDATQADAGWFARPLAWLARVVVGRPRTTLVVTTGLTILAIVYATQNLGFRTSRLDLLNPRSEYNQRWMAYLREFQHEDDVILVVHANSAERRRTAVDALALRLRAEAHLYRDFFYRTDLTPLRSKGLHYLDDQQLSQVEMLVAGSEDILQQRWERQQFMARLAMWGQWLAAQSPANSPAFATGELQRLPPPGSSAPIPPWPAAREWPDLTSHVTAELESLGRFLAGQPFDPNASAEGSMPDLAQEFARFGIHYLESADRLYGFVLVRLGPVKPGEFARGQSSIDRLRAVQNELRAGFPDVEFGLTGLPVMELDEMLTSQFDTTISSVVSLIGVAIIFIVGFGALGYPLFSVWALLYATAWSFAGAAMSVGHLNILSVSFNVIIIGLGIDFGIHFLASYGQWRLEGLTPHQSATKTIVEVGPAILSGGITTALAFGTACVTDFVGVAELGVIAAQGILCCIVAQLTVLPAAMVLFDRRTDGMVIKPFRAECLINPLLPRARHVALATLVLATVLGLGTRFLWYDHNLLHMQADGLESVAWEHRLLEDTDNSAWYALSLSNNPQEILARRDRFQQLPSVHRCEEIVSLIPESTPARQQRIAALQSQLARLSVEMPQLPVISRETMLQALRGFGELTRQIRPQAPWLPALTQLDQLLTGIPNQEYYQRTTSFQQARLADQVRQLLVLRELADPAPPQWDDVPAELRQRFVGQTGTYALKVYAKGSVWDMAALQRFVSEVESVDPRATGQPIQTFYASQQMQSSYIEAGWYALVAVFVTLWLDFRTLRETCLAMLPVLLGMFASLGLLGWLDIPLNPANMIVLPLLLGMGVDDGVHLVHDFRRKRGQYRLQRGTAAAVVLTSLTTMAGFGSLMLARHQGLRSLGLVLTLSMGTCLATSLWFLPMILSWLPLPPELPHPPDLPNQGEPSVGAGVSVGQAHTPNGAGGGPPEDGQLTGTTSRQGFSPEAGPANLGENL